MDTLKFVFRNGDGDETVVRTSFNGALEELLDFFLMCARAVMGYNLPGTLEYFEDTQDDTQDDTQKENSDE